MKTSFKVNPKEETKTIDVDPAKPEQTTALANMDVNTKLGMPTQELQGDFNMSDVNTPKLQIVQAVGSLKAQFPQNEGSWVLNKELVICDPKTQLTMTVARLRKQYIENLPFSEDNLGQARVVDTLEEVRKLGGIVEWGEDENGKGVPPTWVDIANALVIIEAPKGLEEAPLFAYEFEGKRYAAAIWTIRGTAYKSAARSIITAALSNLKPDNGGLAKGIWKATTKYEKRGPNWVHVPYVAQAKESNTDAFKAFCSNIAKV